MLNITFEQLKNAEFVLYENNPVLKPFDSFVVADPSLLTPNEAPDGRWHLFFHTNLGLYHSDSPDSTSFRVIQKVTGRAMRPNINRIGEKYYLFFERTRSVPANLLNFVGLCKWKSEIYVTESEDLKNWNTPRLCLGASRPFESGKKFTSLSNPFLLCENGVNRLYYSCGLTFIEDCGFCEPTYISYAESKRVADGYLSAAKPIIEPDKNSEYLNLCSGCLKVYKLLDGYAGLQNGIFKREDGSHSAIILLYSDDGLNFSFVKPLLEPGTAYGKNWMEQFVYASHLVEYNGELRLYFNARDDANPIKGRECIGFCRAKI